MNALQSCPVQTTTKQPDHSIWDGLLLAGGIAATAFGLNQIPALTHVNPMILAVIIGIIIQRTFKIPMSYTKGIEFSLQKLLKVAIVLLGLQLSIGQLLNVGLNGLLVIMLTLGSTFILSVWFGNRLGLDPRLTRLIASGTSICGASAIVATNSVIRGKDEHVAYAITVVTFFGFLSMILFPIVGRFLELDPTIFGFWAGSSIHETSQVIGASFQGGQESGTVATIAKLSRVLFLIPVIIILGFTPTTHRSQQSPEDKKRLPIPWFVLGFIALVAINSLFTFDPTAKEYIKIGNKFLLTVSLAALGIHMSFSKIKKTGLRPFFLGAAAWIYISIIGLILTKTFLAS